jgi:tetratricopeptide (TPR) repeat protein
MKSNNIKEMEPRYASWSTEDLVRATKVEKDDYEPEAIALMHDELKRRGGVSQEEYNAVNETVENQIAQTEGKKPWTSSVLLIFVILFILLAVVFLVMQGGSNRVATAIAMIVWVLVGAVLLARDTIRRTGKTAYLRVLLTVVIAVIGAASRARKEHPGLFTPDFLAEYAGILLGFWFVVLRPKTKAQESFKKGVSLLKKGDSESALSAFSEGLETVSKNKGKGYLLYNSAVCYVRLGKHDSAIAALRQAFSAFHPLKSKALKDKDFNHLHNNEQFQLLVKKE